MWESEEKIASSEDLKGLEEDSRIALDPDRSETDVEDKGGEDDVEECHKAKAIRQPQEPTRQEIEEHELTHVPFREWCFHCCKGKTRNNPHKVNKNKMMEDEEHAVTTISMDYMYMNEKSKAGNSTGKESEQPVIVIHDRKDQDCVGSYGQLQRCWRRVGDKSDLDGHRGHGVLWHQGRHGE